MWDVKKYSVILVIDCRIFLMHSWELAKIYKDVQQEGLKDQRSEIIFNVGKTACSMFSNYWSYLS